MAITSFKEWEQKGTKPTGTPVKSTGTPTVPKKKTGLQSFSAWSSDPAPAASQPSTYGDPQITEAISAVGNKQEAYDKLSETGAVPKYNDPMKMNKGKKPGDAKKTISNLWGSLTTGAGEMAIRMIDQGLGLIQYGLQDDERRRPEETQAKIAEGKKLGSEKLKGFREEWTQGRLVKSSERLHEKYETDKTFAGKTARAVGGVIPMVVAAAAKVPQVALALSESAMNAEDSYKENIARGMSEVEAIKVAVPQLGADLVGTYVTNKLGFMNKLGGGKSVLKSRLAEYFKDVSLEVTQEIYQQGLQNIATDKPITTGMGETAKLATVVSLLFAGMANVSMKEVAPDKLEAVSEMLPPEIKAVYDEKTTKEEKAEYLDTLAKEQPKVLERAVKNEMMAEEMDVSIPQIAEEMAQAEFEEVKPFLNEEVKEEVEISDDLKPLAEEAQKYDTADEFYDTVTKQENPMFKEKESTYLREGQLEIGKDGRTEVVARERFDIPKLEKVSFGGSDRDVYNLGDNVLKVAKTARGLTQNASSSDYYAEDAGIIPKTIEVGKNYLVKEKVDMPDNNVKKMISELKGLTLTSLVGKIGGYDARDIERQKAYEIMEKYGFPGSDLANYGDILWGDILAIRNWGTKDGKPILLDEGTLFGDLVFSDKTKGKNLTDPEYREIYYRSREAKKKFGDMDQKTKYKMKENEERLIEARGQEVKSQLDEYLKRLKIKLDVNFVNTIVTPENGEAFGAFFDNSVTFSDFITDTTVVHELGHAIFRNLENIPTFKGITREELYVEAQELYGETNREQLEERIMEDLEVYSKKPETFTGKVKEFLGKVMDFLTELFGKRSVIQKFYKTIASGNADIETKITGKDIIAKYKRGDTLDFSKLKQNKTRIIRLKGKEISKIRDEEFGDIEEDADIDSQIPVIRDMPQEIVDQKMELDIIKEYLDSSVGNELEKYVLKKEGVLPEAGVYKDREVPKKIRSQDVRKYMFEGDDILQELNFTGENRSADAQDYYDSFVKMKEIHKAGLKNYKDSLTEYSTEQKSARALERILNNAHKEHIKMVKAREQLDALHARIFKKGFKAGAKSEQAKTKESKQARSYAQDIAMLDLRENIPAGDRWKYLGRIGRIQNLDDYLDVHDAIAQERSLRDAQELISLEESKVRQSIGYIKKIFEVEPSLILSIKDALGIKKGDKLKSIREYNLPELELFKEELKKRIQYRKDNPVRYFDVAKVKKEKGVFGKIGDALSSLDQNIIAPMERTVKKISKPIYESLMTMYFQVNNDLIRYESEIRPLMEVFKKASNEDALKITQYAQSGNMEGLRSILEKYGTPEEAQSMIDSARTVLDEIHAKLKSVGIDVPYRKAYFPRRLKKLTVDQAELLIKTFEYKEGKKFTPEEKTELLNNLARGFKPEQMPVITLSGKRFETHRLLETITDDILPFYEDFQTAMKDYVESTTVVAEQRKFFGKANVDTLDYEKSLELSIGAKLLELKDSGVLKDGDMEKLQDVLQTLMQYRLSKGKLAFQKFTNDYVYPVTLGQISSTINQLKDLSAQLILNDVFQGRLNTLMGVARGLPIKADRIGLSDDLQALESGIRESKGMVAKIGKVIMAPFSAADKFFLRVFINSAYQRAIGMAKSNSPELKKSLDNIFGAEDGARIMGDLQEKTGGEKEIPDEFARWIFSEVAKIRPITKLQKARGAVRSPAFYTLKNFMIKQIEFIRSQGLDVIVEGKREGNVKKVAEGVARLATILAVIGFLGAGVDELKDWILGRRKDDSFWDRMMDNLLQIIGFNQYIITQGQKEGFLKQVIYSYTPAGVSVPGQMIDDAIFDVKKLLDGDSILSTRSIKRLPWAGNLVYSRFGGGRSFIDWSKSTSKELGQFREKVGDTQFKEANKRFNTRYEKWLEVTSELPAFKALAAEEKQKVITAKKAEMRKKIFTEYGFKYVQQKSKPLPKF